MNMATTLVSAFLFVVGAGFALIAVLLAFVAIWVGTDALLLALIPTFFAAIFGYLSFKMGEW